MMITDFLAQLPSPTIMQLAVWVACLIAVLTFYVLLLKAVVITKEAFGRKPPLNDVIGQLATLKQIEEINEKIGNLEDDIEKLRSQHDGNLGTIRDKIEQSFEALDKKRSHDVAELYEQLRKVGSQCVSNAATTEAINQTMHQLSAQLANIPVLIKQLTAK